MSRKSNVIQFPKRTKTSAGERQGQPRERTPEEHQKCKDHIARLRRELDGGES